MTTTHWHPIAATTDLVPFHVHQAMLEGTELAVWRGDDGFVNVWENRCLHRGVRLTIGTTDGAELTCAYHGWRYANRSAGCTYIPAHPADAPARTICNTTFPAVEHDGLVWTTLEDEPASSRPETTGWDEPFPLRPLPFDAPVDLVIDALADYPIAPGSTDSTDSTGSTASAASIVTARQASTIGLREAAGGGELVFHVQPVDDGRCLVRGVLNRRPATEAVGAVLRRHNTALTRLRARLEAETAATDYVDPALRPPVQSETPVVIAGRRLAPLRVRVRRKWATATDVVAVELEPVGNVTLPTAQAGAHIDLHLPNGLVRQYSLTNGPGESGCYRIGVKLVEDSRGGSRFVNQELAEGDELDISEPRPSFPLRRDATRTVLVAGGIGVTPLLAMAQTLERSGLPVELHYFARSDDHLAFPEIRSTLADIVRPHVGLDPAATAAGLRQVIGEHHDASHLYICGPPPMLDAARTIATELGWPEDAVHFEYFGNAADPDRSSTFELSLARSAKTLTVGPGQSILDVLQDAGIAIASSCEQGACGTCVATVIDGEPDHQDVRLSAAERAAGDRIMTCVSRARSPRLVLDL